MSPNSKELQNNLQMITHLNILYNPEFDQCLIETPTMGTVQKYHDKFDMK